MKIVSFAMLKAETAWVWQTPQTLCWEDCFAAAVWRVTASRNPVATRNQLACSVSSKNEQSIEKVLPCWKNVSTCITCASSMSCQSCQLMVNSCSNPVHIHHQYRREGTHTGVKQWPLWENHFFHSFHVRKGSDQWRVSASQCGELKKLEFGRHLGPSFANSLSCWCCCVTASRNTVFIKKHVAWYGSSKNEQSIEQIVRGWKIKHLC